MILIKLNESIENNKMKNNISLISQKFINNETQLRIQHEKSWHEFENLEEKVLLLLLI